MIGQPAEEIGAGAAMMLKAGLYKKYPIPDLGIALHSSPTIPAGKVGFGKGYIMANTESVDIKIYGQGSHGAVPHMSIDPIVTASMIDRREVPILHISFFSTSTHFHCYSSENY